jgi:ribosomal protein S3
MGQKIHPFGFRVGITKKHQSVWFARFQKHHYAQSVVEDRFLRENVRKILSEMFEKKFKNSETFPKISHIHIVRGLIPYEIGIQIHAENCHMVKAAFENVDVQPHILHSFLKNHVLFSTAEKTGAYEKGQKEQPSFASFETSAAVKMQKDEPLRASQKNRLHPVSDSLSKNDGKAVPSPRKKPFVHFRQRFLGKFLVFQNRKQIWKKFDPNAQVLFKKNLRSFLSSSRRDEKMLQNKKNSFSFGQRDGGTRSSSLFSLKRGLGHSSSHKNAFVQFLRSPSTKTNASRACSKFVNFYTAQTNISFFHAFKAEMQFWNDSFLSSKNAHAQEGNAVRSFPFGSQKKWNDHRFESFEKLSIAVLSKLLKALQQKALKKMERLRKEYTVFGKFSKTQTFSYFQRIRFLQNFKKYIALRKAKKSFNVFGKNDMTATERQKTAFQMDALRLDGDKALQKKYQNLCAEKNTMKFVEYFQNFVHQHRSKNIFFYLSTISDARRQLRTLQKFTKVQAQFFFGLSSKSLEGLSRAEQQKIVRAQVSKTFGTLSQKTSFEKKTVKDVLVEQLQKQRTICEQTIQLLPKISLQFYSVKPQDFQTRASAVADSIVDDLEKRKAFRRVIKKAKEDLMKTSKVKGVKIQVSGRLNGAEIARSEWVRAGRVPLQTLRANIDYCYKTAQTMYGIIGVKVWIYKGFTKMRKPTANAPALFSDLV